MTTYTQYMVNIYLIQDTTQQNYRVHLSNPALYVTPSMGTTVTFIDPTGANGDAAGWYICFKDDNSPFVTTKGKAVGTTGNPIQQSTGAVHLATGLQPQDYNYTITIPDRASEDPQVIIGGKGTEPGLLGGKGTIEPGLLGGAAGTAVAAGAAGLLLGIALYRLIAGRD